MLVFSAMLVVAHVYVFLGKIGGIGTTLPVYMLHSVDFSCCYYHTMAPIFYEAFINCTVFLGPWCL